MLAKNSIQAPVLTRNSETKQFEVNLDPQVFEILCEAKHLRKIGLDIPDSAYSICLMEEKLKKNEVRIMRAINFFILASSPMKQSFYLM